MKTEKTMTGSIEREREGERDGGRRGRGRELDDRQTNREKQTTGIKDTYNDKHKEIEREFILYSEVQTLKVV